jgi:hypothetical protein
MTGRQPGFLVCLRTRERDIPEAPFAGPTSSSIEYYFASGINEGEGSDDTRHGGGGRVTSIFPGLGMLQWYWLGLALLTFSPVAQETATSFHLTALLDTKQLMHCSPSLTLSYL